MINILKKKMKVYVQFVGKKEIRNIFYYIEKTYGKHYLKQFKNHK